MSTARDIDEEFGHHQCEMCGTECVEVALQLEQYERELAALRAENERLRTALRDLFGMVENGTLVRDISRDLEPGWAVKQLPLITALTAAQTAIAAPKDKP